MKAMKNNTIIKNLSSNSLGVFIAVFNQLLLVPFFIHFWGLGKYSDWIILTAISNVFALSDIGLNSVISNKFSISYVNNEYFICRKLIINNYLILIFIGGILASIYLSGLFFLNYHELLGVENFDKSSVDFILFCLLMYILLGLYSKILNPIYRAKSKAYRAFFLDNMSWLCETCVLLLGLVFQLNIFIIMICYLLPKIVTIFIKNIETKRFFNVDFDCELFDFGLIKKLLYPSLAFLCFPLGNAITMQGYVFLIDHYYGATMLVLFTTTRTLANLLKFISSIISTSVWPEFSLAFGENDINKMIKYHRGVVKSSLFISLLASAFLLFFGSFIYKLWIKDIIPFDGSILFCFLIIMVVNNFWNTSSMTLLSTNNHKSVSFIYLVSAVVSIVFGLIIAEMFHPVISIIILTALISDIFVSVFVFKKSLLITRDSLSSFILNSNRI